MKYNSYFNIIIQLIIIIQLSSNFILRYFWNVMFWKMLFHYLFIDYLTNKLIMYWIKFSLHYLYFNWVFQIKYIECVLTNVS